jgi:hypothetical protein
VFENRVLRRIFGLKRDEVTGEWRKLHNKELHDLYSSPSMFRIITSRMGLAWHVERMGEKRNAYRTLVGTLEGNIPLEIPRSMWKDIIKMDLRWANKELCDLYSSPSIIRMKGGPCSTNGEKRNAYRLLVGKPEGKRPRGRPRRRWILLGCILERWDGVMWTGLVWLRIGTGGELL